MRLRVRSGATGLALACALVSCPAEGQVGGPHIGVSQYAGAVRWAPLLHLRPGGLVGARASLMLGSRIGLEVNYGLGFTEASAPPQVDWRVKQFSSDLLLRLPLGRVAPHILGGWSQMEFDPGAGVSQARSGWEIGGGVEYQMASRFGLRFEVRDVFVKRSGASANAGSYTHSLFVSGGVSLAMGGRTGEQSLPLPQKNAEINANLANKYSAARDADHDGVSDDRDRCADTPAGAVADRQGCPIDSDGDGVFDGLDQCARTPTGLRVDETGCPIEVREKEIQLLDTGTICLEDVNFDRNKADIPPEALAALDQIGQILSEWPQLRIEIGGHTDNRGTASLNRNLSQRRARAVLYYLLRRFPQLEATRFTAVGHADARSVASNETALGRARNRRVEFKVVNHEALKREIGRRRFLGKGEE